MPRNAPREDPRFATTLAHGIALLECFRLGQPALSNKQLAERSGLSKATVSRLTSTLQARDLILFDAQARGYRLASTALTLGYPLLAALEIRREARLGMKRLADELGGSVSLGIRDRTRMVYVETSRGNDPVAFRPDVGAALPMLQTAMGRAWLAAASAEARAEALSMIHAHTPELHALWIGRLEHSNEEFRRDGFCCSLGDWQPDVFAAAVPLDPLVRGERIVVNCGVPKRLFGKDELVSKVGPKLLRLARFIESHWHDGAQPGASRT